MFVRSVSAFLVWYSTLLLGSKRGRRDESASSTPHRTAKLRCDVVPSKKVETAAACRPQRYCSTSTERDPQQSPRKTANSDCGKVARVVLASQAASFYAAKRKTAEGDLWTQRDNIQRSSGHILLRGRLPVKQTMTITVAMALSGLEPDQWNDGLKDIYMQGAVLFPKSSSTLSLASSGGSSYYSLESGISSMSPDSASYLNQLLVSDFEALGLDGIILDSGKQPVVAQNEDAVTPTPEASNEENDNEKQNLRREAEIASAAVLEEIVAEAMAAQPPVMVQPIQRPVQVIHEGRNVLDLYANIRNGWKYATTYLPDTIQPFYFENRSQYSRLQGGYPPAHARRVCPHKDCSFVETIYF